jgi:hypothetical protein
VRTQLGMQVAWVSEFVGGQQVLRFVDAEDGADAPAEGTFLPLGGSFCARVLDGRFPALMPDARAVPEAALLDVTAQLHIGACVGVPLLGTEGAAVGMLCAISDRPAPSLSDRDVTSLRLLADLLRDLQRRARLAVETAQEQDRLGFVLTAVVGGQGRHPVLQPVVDLRSGRAVAAEGLTRFTLPSPAQPPGAVRSAAQWFDDAGRLGLRRELELATAASVLDLLDSPQVRPGPPGPAQQPGPLRRDRRLRPGRRGRRDRGRAARAHRLRRHARAGVPARRAEHHPPLERVPGGHPPACLSSSLTRMAGATSVPGGRPVGCLPLSRLPRTRERSTSGGARAGAPCSSPSASWSSSSR